MLSVLQLLSIDQVVHSNKVGDLIVVKGWHKSVILRQVRILEHRLALLKRLIIQICVLLVFLVMSIGRGTVVTCTLGATFGLFVDSLEEVSGHGLRLTHLLLALASFTVVLISVATLLQHLLLVLALDSKLVSHAVINHARWQLHSVLLVMS